MTGIEHKNLFRYSISVPVVIGEIHITVYRLTSLTNHLVGMLIRAINVPSIIAIALRELHGAGHVKVEQKLSAALCFEIVADASVEPMIAIAWEIGNAVIQSMSGTIISRVKLCVGEVD